MFSPFVHSKAKDAAWGVSHVSYGDYAWHLPLLLESPPSMQNADVMALPEFIVDSLGNCPILVK